ncbi:haloacid dehalogenase-like hydrolase [Companilactobacillus suantsaicola]|uniref:Haloacid dehalogenase-like hydrolase n=1 Tax=Companilactobacillus suantsaicola TaxID=2487723 RepID=A0A4Z0JIH6_9LACO|nr:haloacid dehalogenase-like hydrolase [Companilactobacillus suantsaicola]TGD22651.1 haloacid dehalogenase-like hydrolase [Companilactobacillus suantsaicola]
MVKRLISATASEISKMSKDDLFTAIKASEGRVVMSENVVIHETVEGGITTSEMVRAFGADMILLNGFDTFNPIVLGTPNQLTLASAQPDESVIKTLKKLVGRPIGVNLEPVDPDIEMLEERREIAKGRQASVESLRKAKELGFDFICLTANPGVGTSNKAITTAIKLAKEHFQGLIIAGKMHKAGGNEPIFTKDVIENYIAAGADILLLPAVGTVWGIRREELKEAVDLAHQHNVLALSAIGTSQESSQPDIIRNMAILNKEIGFDLQHIGDCQRNRFENIAELKQALGGYRHYLASIARSVER